VKRLLALILVSCLHIQPAINISVWTDFLVNNEYIKEVLCINKEQPKMQCGGKCYLMRELQKKKPKQDQEVPQLVHSKYEFAFFSFRESEPDNNQIVNSSDNFATAESKYSRLKTWDIFHPPQV